MKSVRILGVDYEVVYSNTLDLLEGNNHGLMDGLNSRIVINTHSKQQPGTIIHEIIEAIDDRLELGLEHRQITSLDAAFTQVFLDNPQLLTLLKKQGVK